MAKKESVGQAQPSLKYQRERDKTPVRGKFIFHEVPGGVMSFNYKKYKEDEVERYDLTDGQIYTIPLGVAKHLNKNCSYPIHSYLLDDAGKPMQRVGEMKRRCSFQSLEFIDDIDLAGAGNSIVMVENMI